METGLRPDENGSRSSRARSSTGLSAAMAGPRCSVSTCMRPSRPIRFWSSTARDRKRATGIHLGGRRRRRLFAVARHGGHMRRKGRPNSHGLRSQSRDEPCGCLAVGFRLPWASHSSARQPAAAADARSGRPDRRRLRIVPWPGGREAGHPTDRGLDEQTIVRLMHGLPGQRNAEPRDARRRAVTDRRGNRQPWRATLPRSRQSESAMTGWTRREFAAWRRCSGWRQPAPQSRAARAGRALW